MLYIERHERLEEVRILFASCGVSVIADATKQLLTADPAGMAADVASVEAFLIEEPQKRLAFQLTNRYQIDEPAQAKKVLLAEKLSPLIRSLAMVSLLADLLSHQHLEFHRDVLLYWIRKEPPMTTSFRWRPDGRHLSGPTCS